MPSTWNEYTSISSVHGFNHISNQQRNARRIIWMVLLFLSFLAFTIFAAFTLYDYFQYNVKTVVSVSNADNAIFPTVTICNMNSLRSTKVSYDNEVLDYLQYGRNVPLRKAADLPPIPLDQVPHISGEKLRKIYQDYGHKMYNNLNSSGEQGMLFVCEFDGIKCNHLNFTEVLTPLGLCHSFNNGKSAKLLSVPHPGMKFGLKLRLTVQSQNSMLVQDTGVSSGLKIFIHDQHQLPLVHLYGLAIAPGTHAFIGLTRKKIVNLESPYKTHCRRYTESGTYYRSANCLQKCEEKYLQKRCQCNHPLQLTEGLDQRFGYCNMTQWVACYIPETENFKQARLNCGCPEPCEEVEYQTEMSHAGYPSTEAALQMANFLRVMRISDWTVKESVEYMKENIIVINIFYRQLNYAVVEQLPAVILSDICSKLGGLMGIFLGASFLSAAEFIDFLISYFKRKCLQFGKSKLDVKDPVKHKNDVIDVYVNNNIHYGINNYLDKNKTVVDLQY